MKKILLITIATLGFSFAAQASWQSDHCMSSCASSMNSDTGSNAESCGGSWSSCSCVGIANGCPAMIRTNCNFGETNYGSTVQGKKCCVNTALCRADEETLPEMELKLENEVELEEVFAEHMGILSTAHYGYINDNNRSPNAGRAQSVDARLDACLGHGTADTIGGSLLTCYSKCDNATNGSDTNYCHSNNSAVCDDRCECKLGSGSCDNL